MRLRQATGADVGAVMEIKAQARACQARQGNPQWAPGYPSRQTLRQDISSGGAVVLEAGGAVAGYATAVECDAGYAATGLWDDESAAACRWCAIHRLALADGCRGTGAGKWFLGALLDRLSAQGYREARLDTGEANVAMQRVALGAGFRCLGLARFPWGPRLAYSRPL